MNSIKRIQIDRNRVDIPVKFNTIKVGENSKIMKPCKDEIASFWDKPSNTAYIVYQQAHSITSVNSW